MNFIMANIVTYEKDRLAELNYSVMWTEGTSIPRSVEAMSWASRSTLAHGECPA
jgi:hypothetical protein